MATYKGRFQLLAKPASEWNGTNPVLLLGEYGVADPGGSLPYLKVGDGVRPWSALPNLMAPVIAANDYVVGVTTTLPAGSAATVVIDNTVDPPTINFGLPQGAQGPQGIQGIQGPTGATGPQGATGPVGPTGPANSLAIGTVTTGAPGAPADAVITGTPPNQQLSLTIPQGIQGPVGATGPTGPANSLTIGEVITGAPGSFADAEITGTPPNQVLSLTIPQGPVGPQGPQGEQGVPGSAGAVLESDSHVTGEWNFDPTMWFGYTDTEITAVKATVGLYINDADEAAHFKGRVRMERANAEPFIRLARVNGTYDAPTHVLNNQLFSRVEFGGTSVDGIVAPVRLQGIAIQDWVSGQYGSRLDIMVVPPNSTSIVSALAIRGDRVESSVPLFAGFSSTDAAAYVGNTTMQGFDSTDGAHVQTRFHVDRLNSGAPLYLRRVNGSYAVNTPIQNGDGVGAVHFSGSVTAGGAQTGASIVGVALGAWTPTSAPACLQFGAALAGSNVTTLRLQVGHANYDVVGGRSGSLGTGCSFGGNGSTAIQLGASGSGYAAVGCNVRFTGTTYTYQYQVNDTASLIDFESGDLKFYGAPTGVAGATIPFVKIAELSRSAGAIRVGDGSTSFPSHSFMSEPGMGFYRGVAGQTIFAAVGGQRVIMAASDSPLRMVANAAMGRNYLLFYRDNASTAKGYVGYGGTADDNMQVWNQEAAALVFGAGNVEGMRLGREGQLQITGTYTGNVLRPAPGIELGIGGSGTIGVMLTYNRSNATYLPLQINGSYLDIQGPTPTSTQVRLGNRRAFAALDTNWLRLNNDGDFTSGIYTPFVIRADGGYYSDLGIADTGNGRVLRPNLSTLSYGAWYVTGTVGGFHGIGVEDGGLRPIFMSNNASAGIYVQGDAKWLAYRATAGTAVCEYTLTASGFQVASSRTLKRETGAPHRVRDLLSKLRPIFFRLLDGDDREQLGLIAEEVHEVCPQLSDGKSVMYDRLALLLLADWQESRASA